MNDPKLIAIAKKYSTGKSQPTPSPSRLSLVDRVFAGSESKSTAQILIRWALQRGLVVIPKSANRRRIFEDADVFDFEITAADRQLLDSFNENLRTAGIRRMRRERKLSATRKNLSSAMR